LKKKEKYKRVNEEYAEELKREELLKIYTQYRCHIIAISM